MAGVISEMTKIVCSKIEALIDRRKGDTAFAQHNKPRPCVRLNDGLGGSSYVADAVLSVTTVSLPDVAVPR